MAIQSNAKVEVRKFFAKGLELKNHNHTFSYIKDSSWGIYIRITGSISNLDKLSDKHTVKLDENIHLSIEDLLASDSEIEYVKKSILSLSDKINSLGDNGQKYLVKLTILYYRPTDYQDEGMYHAIRDWLASFYGWDLPEISARFDRENNRYIFDDIPM